MISSRISNWSGENTTHNLLRQLVHQKNTLVIPQSIKFVNFIHPLKIWDKPHEVAHKYPKSVGFADRDMDIISIWDVKFSKINAQPINSFTENYQQCI